MAFRVALTYTLIYDITHHMIWTTFNYSSIACDMTSSKKVLQYNQGAFTDVVSSVDINMQFSVLPLKCRIKSRTVPAGEGKKYLY
jgi:hypothetical protein